MYWKADANKRKLYLGDLGYLISPWRLAGLFEQGLALGLAVLGRV